MRIKGKYVAVVEADFDFEYTSEHRSFEEIKKVIVGGELTAGIKEAIDEEIFSGYANVTVTQQYADLYEVEE